MRVDFDGEEPHLVLSPEVFELCLQADVVHLVNTQRIQIVRYDCAMVKYWLLFSLQLILFEIHKLLRGQPSHDRRCIVTCKHDHE